MTRRRPSGLRLRPRFGGQARGFSLVELLVALAICGVISGAIAGAVRPSREAFERTPAALDLQQRGRAALESLSVAIRSAGRNVTATQDLGRLADLLPPVLLADPDASGQRFSRLTAVIPTAFPAQGTLAHDQPARGGALALAATPCPDIGDVCGFTAGSTAVIADGSGRFDIFGIASTNPGARRLSITAPFAQPYPAGSVIVEVDAWTFRLDAQVDGSLALVRRTAAGAVQPIVDGVAELWFEAEGPSDAGELIPIGLDLLDDGPWQMGGLDGLYDEDAFRVRQVRVGLRLHALDRAMRSHVRDRMFRMAVTLRNAP